MTLTRTRSRHGILNIAYNAMHCGSDHGTDFDGRAYINAGLWQVCYGRHEGASPLGCTSNTGKRALVGC